MHRRTERAAYWHAWQTAHLMNATGNMKETVRVWDLLPELIGADATKRLHRQSLQPYLDARKRRPVTA